MTAGGGRPVAVAAVKTVHTIVFLGELAAIGWLGLAAVLHARSAMRAARGSAVGA